MTPDWQTIASWAGGITTVIGSIGIAIWLAITRAMQIAKTLPAPVTRTDVITTDSVAMQQLASSVEANTMEMTQTNRLLMEIVTVGRDFTEMMRKEREEAEFEAEVDKRIKERERERRRRSRAKTTPVRRRPRPAAET